MCFNNPVEQPLNELFCLDTVAKALGATLKITNSSDVLILANIESTRMGLAVVEAIFDRSRFGMQHRYRERRER